MSLEEALEQACNDFGYEQAEAYYDGKSAIVSEGDTTGYSLSFRDGSMPPYWQKHNLTLEQVHEEMTSSYFPNDVTWEPCEAE